MDEVKEEGRVCKPGRWLGMRNRCGSQTRSGPYLPRAVWKLKDLLPFLRTRRLWNIFLLFVVPPCYHFV